MSDGDSSDRSGDAGVDSRRSTTTGPLITKPGPHDVLCGRGGGTNNHCGNVSFRQMVNEHKLRYLAASKVEKPKVAREVVQLWRAQDPPGRFLARKDDSRKGPGSVKAEGNVWYDVGDKKAREKASQCLRERTPDVIPFVREMQRQQDFLTGHGLRYVEQQMKQGTPPPGSTSHSSSTSSPAYKSQTISEPEVANAFSVEHFAANAAFNNQRQQQQNAFNRRPSDSRSHMSQEEQWQMFQMANLDNVAQPPAYFPDSQVSNAFAQDPHAFDIQPPDADELTLDEYAKSMEEFFQMQKNNLSSESELPTDMQMRTKTLEDMKQDSWVKSFYSVETKDSKDSHEKRPRSKQKKKRSTLEATIQRSQRSNQAHTLASQGMSTRTDLTSGTQMTTGTLGSKMSTLSNAFSTMSGVSMFSDMSEDSRAEKMSAARGLTSNLSIMSDMTDLSESLKSLDLATGHYKHH